MHTKKNIKLTELHANADQCCSKVTTIVDDLIDYLSFNSFYIVLVDAICIKTNSSDDKKHRCLHKIRLNRPIN